MIFTLKQGEYRGLIVHISGTHGVEGHAGKLIQDSLKKKFDKKNSCSILLVEQLNEWGFKNDERYTEHNVNLNRAGSTCKPNNDNFAKVHKALERKHKTVDELKADIHKEWWWGLPGPIKKAIMSGQDTFPNDIEYTGEGVAWQILKVAEYVQEHLQKTQTRDQPLAIVDVHTGVGKPDTGDMLITDNTWQKEQLLQVIDKESQGRIHQPYPVHGSVMTSLYNLLRGKHCRSSWFDWSTDVFHNRDVVVTQEFATVDELQILNALINKKQDAKVNLHPYFFVQNKKWQKQVVDRGTTIVTQIMHFWKASENKHKALQLRKLRL